MAKENIDLSVVLHDDSDYKDWLVELKERFYSHRLKASCATNGYLLDFYWKLGRDIEAKQYTNNYGSGFYKNLSQDLKNEMPGVKGFSPINLRYMSKFFKLYAPLCEKVPQAAELFSDSLSDSNVPQAADDFKMFFLIPWDHHRRIIDKCKDDVNKENLSIAEMSGKKLDRFRKVCASVHFIPPRLYASYATCSHCTIPTNRLPQRRDSPLFPLPDNMFQMEFFLILLDEETY